MLINERLRFIKTTQVKITTPQHKQTHVVLRCFLGQVVKYRLSYLQAFFIFPRKKQTREHHPANTLSLLTLREIIEIHLTMFLGIHNETKKRRNANEVIEVCFTLFAFIVVTLQQLQPSIDATLIPHLIVKKTHSGEYANIIRVP